MGVQSPKLFSENNHSVIFTANIQKCPKTCNTWVGGGPESQTNTWNFVRKISHFFKKIKCSKQPKKQNKPNFHLSLSGVPNVRGGWVGSDVWDKVPKKTFFLGTFPKGQFGFVSFDLIKANLSRSPRQLSLFLGNIYNLGEEKVP